MKTTVTYLLLVTASLLFSACASPDYLQKDFGLSYHQAFSTQADLNRESAADHAYPLTAAEALEVAAAKTDKSKGEGASLPLIIPGLND